MFILYDIAFFIFAIGYLPIFFFRKKFHSKFKMKFGFISKGVQQKLRERELVWVHAVSVGEVIAAKEIIDQLRVQFPDCRIVISTVTKTGNEVARTLTKENDLVMYLPFDVSFMVRRVFRKTHIKCFVLMETELWPNLIQTLYRKKVPVFLVNGRISPRSYGSYKMIKVILAPLLGSFRFFLMQSQYDAKRIIDLGAPRDKVRVTGNIKFDINILDEGFQKRRDQLSKKVVKNKDEVIFIAGSTHPKEEEILLDVFVRLYAQFKGLKMILACRHIERIEEVKKIIGQRNLSYSLFSQQEQGRPLAPVTLLDTLGDLKYLYGVGDIVFIGGSLIPKGGHNIIEPACVGKPILSGSYFFNFQDIVETFIRKKAICIVANKEELAASLSELITDEGLRIILGKRAQQVVEENRGVTKRIIAVIGTQLGIPPQKELLTEQDVPVIT